VRVGSRTFSSSSHFLPNALKARALQLFTPKEAALHLVLTEKMLSKLEEKRIYTSGDGSRRLNVGDTIVFSGHTPVAPYSAVLAGIIFPNMGSFSYTQSQVPDWMTIGRYCSIAHGLSIIGGNHPTDYVSTSSFSYDANFSIFSKCIEDFDASDFIRYGLKLSRPDRHDVPLIGNDVWIGGGVTLGRGITLGDGCVVAAESCVTKSVPPYAIVGGNPARVIRMRFDDLIIERLLKSKWWRYKFSDFGQMQYNDVGRFLDNLDKAVEFGKISVFPKETTTLADFLAE
jgi:acetyltransferase-like isoleucine patch superfamily enzyme